jgi:hypothetical protein
MTREELQRRAADWFTEDDQDQPEIVLDGADGRAGVVFDFLRSHGGAVDADSEYWDPVNERSVLINSVANAAAEFDAGRAAGFVACFSGIHYAGVALPDICLFPLRQEGGNLNLFWDCGPQWDRSGTIAAFFDLLAGLERECSVQLSFAGAGTPAVVGRRFGRLFREWHQIKPT